jgi:hypothetical protein
MNFLSKISASSGIAKGARDGAKEFGDGLTEGQPLLRPQLAGAVALAIAIAIFSGLAAIREPYNGLTDPDAQKFAVAQGERFVASHFHAGGR